MRKLIGFLFAAAALAAGFFMPLSEAIAADFTRGEKLSHSLSLCLNKADALEIMKADSEKGFEAADAIWQTKDECVTAPVVGPTVGKVVASAQIVRDGTRMTMRVVEILDVDGKVLAYFFTTGTIDQRAGSKDHPTIKGDRNT